MITSTRYVWPHLGVIERALLVILFPFWALTWCVFWAAYWLHRLRA